MVEKIGSQLFKKNNAGLMAKLAHKASHREFIISTTHLNWNPKLDFVKYAQMVNMFQRIQGFDSRVKEDKIPVIMCGDMNCPPTSQLFAFMKGEKVVPYDKVDAKNVHLYDKVTEEANKESLSLVGKMASSYSKYPG